MATRKGTGTLGEPSASSSRNRASAFKDASSVVKAKKEAGRGDRLSIASS